MLRKVFHKKKNRAAGDLCLCHPRGGKKTMGSRHLPLGALHFIGAMKRQRQLSAGQSSHTSIWLAALLSLRSLSSSLSESLHLNLSPSHCVFHSITPPPKKTPHRHKFLFASSCCEKREPPSPYSLSDDKYLLCCPDLFWVNY